ncbi:MAG: DUF2723 domain-containing protein [Candidatus Eisenbacteria bacterium]|uniref:DUF2723 domain-containing protein n=1 Tax=Eiseniibacteriota bacterium TaxID=2212470 RepID=A0A933W2N1_UNCEI|nr:DUF2723 domain-containing protein [Candidatus Eisenbacteria bacterium]
MSRPPESSRAPALPAGAWRWIALAFAGALAIYATGAAPTVLEGDSGELQAVALAGGVAHSSGYPLFCLVSRLFALLPGDPAFRINLMSACFGAAGVATLVACGIELGLGGAAALAAGILFGAGFSWWSASLRAEVYTLSLFVMLLAWRHVNFALHTRAPRDRIVAAVLLGVACTGHLSHLGAVACLGLALAWAAWREGRTWPEWPALVGAFVLGLTPYLYLVWADHVNLGFDYLDYVDHIFYPGTGVPDARLDGAFERLRWLVFGRNLLPGSPMEFHPGDLLRAIRKHSVPVGLFELGLPATALVVPGFVRMFRLDAGQALRMLVLTVATLLLAAQVSFGGLFALFLLFPLALVSLLAALGLEWALGFVPRGAWRSVSVPLAAALLMVPTHELRRRAYVHPIGQERLMVHDEGSNRPLRLMYRRLKQPYAVRDFGRAIVRAVPDSALLVANWPDMGVVLYHTYGLRERGDLTLMQLSRPQYLIRARVWQERHDLARRPIVFLSMPPDVRAHLAVADSLDLSGGRWAYVVRTALTDLPATRGDRLGE